MCKIYLQESVTTIAPQNTSDFAVCRFDKSLLTPY